MCVYMYVKVHASVWSGEQQLKSCIYFTCLSSHMLRQVSHLTPASTSNFWFNGAITDTETWSKLSDVRLFLEDHLVILFCC